MPTAVDTTALQAALTELAEQVAAASSSAPGPGDLLPGRRQGGRGRFQAAGGVAGGHGGVLEDRLGPVDRAGRAPGVVARVGGRR